METWKRLTYEPFECPICQQQLENPNELREHRLKQHKSVFDEIKANNI
jgi:hypothetical protein